MGSLPELPGGLQGDTPVCRWPGGFQIDHVGVLQRLRPAECPCCLSCVLLGKCPHLGRPAPPATLPTSAAFGGQAGVRPPSGHALAGLARGQLKARRRLLALGEPPSAEAAPQRSPGSSPGGEWDQRPAAALRLTPACPRLRAPAGPSQSLPHRGHLPGFWGLKSGFSLAIKHGS